MNANPYRIFNGEEAVAVAEAHERQSQRLADLFQLVETTMPPIPPYFIRLASIWALQVGKFESGITIDDEHFDCSHARRAAEILLTRKPQ